MGKHFRVKQLDDESRHNKQPGCMSRLAHVLGYRHWRPNTRKMIGQRIYEGPIHDRCDWASVTSMYNNDGYEAEKLLDEKKSSPLVDQSTKRPRAAKKRSLRTRIKSLIPEEITRESDQTRAKQGFSSKSKLQRTYSIHHLESLDKYPIIFLPKNVDQNLPATQSLGTAQTKGGRNQEATRGRSRVSPVDATTPDSVLEIFKVDKGLLIKHLADADEDIANFSRTALGLNTTKARFSKSRSFPNADLAQGRKKLKPIKLETKQKEVWSFPRKSSFEEVADGEAKDIMTDITGENQNENDIRKQNSHRSSSSLNIESLDKYARLFENNFKTDAKLNPSKSLRLTNEHVHAPVSFRRIRSLSNVDPYYSNLNFEVLGNDPSGNGSDATVKDRSLDVGNIEEENVSDAENVAMSERMQIEEDDASLRLHTTEEDNCLQDTMSHAIELQVSEGLEHGSITHESSFSVNADHDLESPTIKPLSTYDTRNLENDEVSDKFIKSFPHKAICQKTNNSDLSYVRCLVDQSGIASEMTWHASYQPLSPDLFEEIETHWGHERDQLNGWPDFYGCWQHRMLFDLVNDVLLEVYDESLMYYPKALSSSCHVGQLPRGDRITEEVCRRIGSLLDLKTEEKHSLDCMVDHDLSRDHSWMNLQLDSEDVALDIEDVIFHELLEDVMFS